MDPVKMPELKCEKVNDTYILRNGERLALLCQPTKSSYHHCPSLLHPLHGRRGPQARPPGLVVGLAIWESATGRPRLGGDFDCSGAIGRLSRLWINSDGLKRRK